MTSISNSEQKTNYLTNKKMLIVINYSHSGFTWRIKSHEELKETAFFFFYVGEAVILVCFNCTGFHVLVRSKGKGDILTGRWAAIMRKTPFQLPYKLLSVGGRRPACSRIRDSRFHGTLKAEHENITGFSRFIHAPL